jgi:hypothetical protein
MDLLQPLPIKLPQFGDVPELRLLLVKQLALEMQIQLQLLRLVQPQV